MKVSVIQIAIQIDGTFSFNMFHLLSLYVGSYHIVIDKGFVKASKIVKENPLSLASV